MFCLFILKGGRWVQWGEPFANQNDSWARQELDYLTNKLGVTAQMFKRKAA